MKILRPQFAALLILSLLSGCLEFTPGPPGDANLSSSTVYMTGVVERQVSVYADGAWSIRSSNSWLRVQPDHGVGSGTVRLTVDPGGLEPGEHVSGITLTPEGEYGSKFTPVVFSFPRLRGSIVHGPAAAGEPSLLSAQALPSGPGRLLVGFTDSSPARFGISENSDVTGFRSLAAGTVESRSGMRLLSVLPASRVALVRANDMRAAAAELRRDPKVRYVEQDVYLEQLAFDPERSKQWALDVTNVNEDTWAIGDGSGVRVAVIDAGFDRNHDDLKNNVAEAWDMTSSSPTELPRRPGCGTHGEHVAGIIAAQANNMIGVAGMARGAKLILLNVGGEPDKISDCPITTAHLAAALEWVTGDAMGPRADVVNISLGSHQSTETLRIAIENAYSAGVTIVAATGNDGGRTVMYPAGYPQVMAVSATGKNDELATYSTTGAKVLLSAPGGNDSDGVLNTVFKYNGGTVEYGYGYMMGTSMASPAVAAVAALVLSVNPNLKPVGIAGLLIDSSVDLGSQGRDDSFGYGRVDAYAAVSRAQSMGAEPPGYRLKVNGAEYAIPADEQFVAGYVGGTVMVQVGSDENWNGRLDESGEYYGALSSNVPFTGEFFDVTISVAKQP